MTVEQLLVPRYRVISSFPGMKEKYMHHVGDTFTDDGRNAVMNQDDRAVYPVEWHEYPHIYREMGWWEEREESDMPAYVKWADDKETRPAPYVRKVVSHFNKANPDFRTHSVKHFLSEDGSTYTYSPFLPATEEEFLNQ